MKKILLILILATSFNSCKKDTTSNNKTNHGKTGTCKDSIPTKIGCPSPFGYVGWVYDSVKKQCVAYTYCDSGWGNKNKLECLSCANILDTSKNYSFLVLKLDYKTLTFEGGKELKLKGPLESSANLNIESFYNPPSDYGDIAFKFMPLEQTLFSGTIIWMGGGYINYPNFEPANNFSRLAAALPLPNRTIKNLHTGYIADRDFSKVWASINKIEKVKDYLNETKDIGLYVYTPTVGKTDTSVAKWIIIMQKSN